MDITQVFEATKETNGDPGAIRAVGCADLS